MTRAFILAPLAALVLFAAGCGDDEDSGGESAGTNAATTPAETTAEAPAAGGGAAPTVSNAEDLSSKPQIETPEGDPPPP